MSTLWCLPWPRAKQDGKIVPFHMLCSGHDALRAMFSACQDKVPYKPGTNKALYAIDWFAANPNLPVPWNVIGIEVGYVETHTHTYLCMACDAQHTHRPTSPSSHTHPHAKSVRAGAPRPPSCVSTPRPPSVAVCGVEAAHARTARFIRSRTKATCVAVWRAWAASKAIAIGVKVPGLSARSSALHWTTQSTDRSGRTGRSWVTLGR